MTDNNIIEFKLKKSKEQPIRVYEREDIEQEMYEARMTRIRLSLERITQLMDSLKEDFTHGN